MAPLHPLNTIVYDPESVRALLDIGLKLRVRRAYLLRLCSCLFCDPFPFRPARSFALVFSASFP